MLPIGGRYNPKHSSHTCMNFPRIAVSLLAVLVTLAAILVPEPGLAGIRGPGKYAGIVIFDRWGTCILFSGVYLMYISENVKEGLRPYEGQAVQIDAIDVVQPINPGDGLIKKYRLLGLAPATTHSAVPIVPEGVVLTANGPSTSDGLPQVSVEIRNEGNESVRILTSEIGIALLTKKEGDYWPFDPSDGPSTAAITRARVTNSDGSLNSRRTGPNGPIPTWRTLIIRCLRTSIWPHGSSEAPDSHSRSRRESTSLSLDTEEECMRASA